MAVLHINAWPLAAEILPVLTSAKSFILAAAIACSARLVTKAPFISISNVVVVPTVFDEIVMLPSVEIINIVFPLVPTFWQQPTICVGVWSSHGPQSLHPHPHSVAVARIKSK